MALKVGTHAPDFTLPSKPGETLALSSLRGKSVVLLFFPGAPDKSSIYEAVTLPKDDDGHMPPKGDDLTAEQIALRQWTMR